MPSVLCRNDSDSATDTRPNQDKHYSTTLQPKLCPMNPTTKAVIVAALENDTSIAANLLQSVLSLLDGGQATLAPATNGPILLTASAAAKRLGISRTTFWRLVRKKRVSPVEITPGVFRYHTTDVDSLTTVKSRYRPRQRYNSTALNL